MVMFKKLEIPYENCRICLTIDLSCFNSATPVVKKHHTPAELARGSWSIFNHLKTRRSCFDQTLGCGDPCPSAGDDNSVVRGAKTRWRVIRRTGIKVDRSLTLFFDKQVAIADQNAIQQKAFTLISTVQCDVPATIDDSSHPRRIRITLIAITDSLPGGSRWVEVCPSRTFAKCRRCDCNFKIALDHQRRKVVIGWFEVDFLLQIRTQKARPTIKNH